MVHLELLEKSITNFFSTKRVLFAKTVFVMAQVGTQFIYLLVTYQNTAQLKISHKNYVLEKGMYKNLHNKSNLYQPVY